MDKSVYIKKIGVSSQRLEINQFYQSILQEVEAELPADKRTGYELSKIVDEFLGKNHELDVEKIKILRSELDKVHGQA
mgnify:CR=1 FL=1